MWTNFLLELRLMPDRLLDKFSGLRWRWLDPEFLDYEYCELLLIGERQGNIKSDSEGKVDLEEVKEELEILEDKDLERAEHLSGKFQLNKAVSSFCNKLTCASRWQCHFQGSPIRRQGLSSSSHRMVNAQFAEVYKSCYNLGSIKYQAINQGRLKS